MSHALFSFDDVRAAEVAAERLRQCGVPAADVGVHAKGAHTAASAAASVDELVTGGLLGNLYGLLQGLFDGDAATSRHARDYGEHLLRGGAVVSVRLDDEGQRAGIERLMEGAGATRRTGWSSRATA